MAIKLNIAPVTFKDKTIYIEEFRYSDERFNQLLNEYRKTHLIQRSGDRIQVIPLRMDSASTRICFSTQHYLPGTYRYLQCADSSPTIGIIIVVVKQRLPCFDGRHTWING